MINIINGYNTGHLPIMSVLRTLGCQKNIKDMDTLKTLLLSDLHFEHVQWLNELRFWEDELKSFNNRLTETIMKDISQEAKAQIEHFHNKFILHEKAIDQIKNEVKRHESVLAQISAGQMTNLSDSTVVDHASIRDSIATERAMYTELKSDYYSFLSRTLQEVRQS
jgi:predicted  nucleic acid-binding Zn-ribbon protein